MRRRIQVGISCLAGAAASWCVAALIYTYSFGINPPWSYWSGPYFFFVAFVVAVLGLPLTCFHATKEDRAAWCWISLAAALGTFLGFNLLPVHGRVESQWIAVFAEDPLHEFHRVVTVAVLGEALFALLAIIFLGNGKRTGTQEGSNAKERKRGNPDTMKGGT